MEEHPYQATNRKKIEKPNRYGKRKQFHKSYGYPKKKDVSDFKKSFGDDPIKILVEKKRRLKEDNCGVHHWSLRRPDAKNRQWVVKLDVHPMDRAGRANGKK